MQDSKTPSIDQLAKHGHFEELCRRASSVENRDLARIFNRAVTDFRTVKRTPGHQRILQWCIDQGLDFTARSGWLNQSIVCLAARNGNNEIIESMRRRGLPEDPFVRASVGDVEFLERCARQRDLSDLQDENGFNLLYSCAGSGLDRRDEHMKQRLVDVCRLLLDHDVRPTHEVVIDLPIYPAFLCASFGGNEEVMRLLVERGGLKSERFHQTLEHTLEPHQRSGEPFYHIAELLVGSSGFALNARGNQGRTLLHGAANRGTLKAVRWLLEHGADPNALDEHGRTPLHVGAQRNTSISVVKLLIDAGSDPNARDALGKIPLDYAVENKRVKVVSFLAAAGAQ